jgi:hypothetical protein
MELSIEARQRMARQQQLKFVEMAFALYLELEALGAQNPGAEVEQVEQMRVQLQAKKANAEASARKMQEILEALDGEK